MPVVHTFFRSYNQCMVVEIVTKKTNVSVFFFSLRYQKIANEIVHRDFQKVICQENQLVNEENDYW